VTGATGFAGTHLVERLLATHPSIGAWRHTHGRPLRSVDPRVQWQSVDLLNRASVKQALLDLRPGVIFHLAGLPHVAESWKSGARALEVNALGTHHLFEAVEEVLPACTVVVAGSALVYRPSSAALAEDDVLGPVDPYGVSKLAQEMRAAGASTAVVLTRPFNHAGPGQSDAFVTSSFAKQIAEIEAGLREPRLLVGNLEAKRDIMDVRDTARAYEALAESGVRGRVYNICSGAAYRIGDLLDRLVAMARVPVNVRQDPARLRPSDNPVVLGDPSRILADTGWRPEISIDTTLADLLAWWRAIISAAR
jgi:GDP-4-dehydro-6-deoxy-D-mannose reductase